MAKYRILSLDGGGPWALIQVKALQRIYGATTSGHDVLKNFDLVAANTGGSLTLAGLIEDTRLDVLLERYFMNEHNRKAVFRDVGFWSYIRNFLFHLAQIAPKYSADAKRSALTGILSTYGATRLSEIVKDIRSKPGGKCPHFVICSFDFDRKRAIYYRSDLASKAQSSGGVPQDPILVDAVHASTNAPVTFFDAPAHVLDRRCWDGAIAGNNNPVLVGLVEALADNQQNQCMEIQALSIGTGSVRMPARHQPPGSQDPHALANRREKYRILGNVRDIATSILDDPPDAATFIAHVVLGQPLPPPATTPAIPTSGSVIRLNPMIQPVLDAHQSWEPPPGLNLEELNYLANLPVDAIEQDQIQHVEKMCDQWLDNKVRNQPIRSNASDFSCEIGHDWFRDALAAWNALAAAPDRECQDRVAVAQ